MMASGRTALASSGMISGIGLASARISGLSAMLRHHLRLQHAGRRQAEEDVGAVDHLGQRARLGLAGVARLVWVHLLGSRPCRPRPSMSADDDVLALQTQIDQQVQAGERRRAGAGGHQLDLLDLLADHLQAVEHRRADDDGGAVLVVVEDRDLHALAQFRSMTKHSGALMSSRLMPPKVGSSAAMMSTSLSGSRSSTSMSNTSMPANFLNRHRLALHHRLGGQRPDVAQAEHRGAVGDHRHQIAARGVLGRRQGSASISSQANGDARRIGQRQVALVGQRLGGLDLQLPGRGMQVIVKCGFLQFLGQGSNPLAA